LVLLRTLLFNGGKKGFLLKKFFLIMFMTGLMVNISDAYAVKGQMSSDNFSFHTYEEHLLSYMGKYNVDVIR